MSENDVPVPVETIDKYRELLLPHDPGQPVSVVYRGVPKPGFLVRQGNDTVRYFTAQALPDEIDGWPIYYEIPADLVRKADVPTPKGSGPGPVGLPGAIGPSGDPNEPYPTRNDMALSHIMSICHTYQAGEVDENYCRNYISFAIIWLLGHCFTRTEKERPTHDECYEFIHRSLG